jgi:hypothetical protein
MKAAGRQEETVLPPQLPEKNSLPFWPFIKRKTAVPSGRQIFGFPL